MIKKYSLLTILTVIILVGSSAEHLLGQLPPIKSLKGKSRQTRHNHKRKEKPETAKEKTADT